MEFDPDAFLASESAFATTFADPEDIRRFRLAKARGLSDREAFKYGDNGIGKWSDDTTRIDDPIVALPRDLPGVAHNRAVEVTGPDGRSVVARVADVMPARKNITNSAGIDLNPAAAAALGVIGGKTPVQWRFVDSQAASPGAAAFDPDAFLAEESTTTAATSAFDPDAFLAEESFDPDKFLAEPTAPVVAKSPPPWQQELDRAAAQQQIEQNAVATGPGSPLAAPAAPIPDDETISPSGAASAPLFASEAEAVAAADALRERTPKIGAWAETILPPELTGAHALGAVIKNVFPQNETAQIVGSSLQGVGKAIAGLTAIEMLPVLAAGGPSGRLGQALLAAGFEADTVSHLPEVLKASKAAKTKPEKAEIWATFLTGAAVPAFAGGHALFGHSKPRGETLKTFADLPADLVAPEPLRTSETRLPVVEPDAQAANIVEPGRTPAATPPATAGGPVIPSEAEGSRGATEAVDYPIAKEVVDGRTVTDADNIPNQGSISASLGDYEILTGVREVPMSDFELTGKHYSASGQRSIDSLAEQIQNSSKITPLIVVTGEANGPYILEGATRAEALAKIGAKSFPALVVKDLEAIAKSAKPAEPAAGGSDVFGFGPGAAAAREPLASYEKRKFGERLQQDNNLAQELRENIGERYYEPIPNTVTVEEAIKLTNERPVSDTINAIRDEASGIPFHVRATMGQLVVKRLNQAFHNLREKNPAEAETVLNHAVDTSEWLSRFGTELGQGVQAFSMWSRLTPEGKLVSLQRSVRKTRDRYTAEHGEEVAQILDTLNTEGMAAPARADALRKLSRSNVTARKVKPHLDRLLEAVRTGKMTDEKFYEIAGDRLGLPKWDKQTAAEIMRLSTRIDAAPEGMPRDQATLELSKFISRQKGLDARDVPIGIYYGNMLSGYNTQIVNALDTFLNVASEINGLAVSNPRSAAKIYRKALRGFLDGRLDFISALTRGRMVTDAKWLEVPRLMEVAEFGRKGGVPINVKSRGDAVIKAIAESRPAVILNAWKYVTRLMAASDAFMYRGAYEARSALLADRVARQENLSGRALDRRVEELMGHNELQTHRYQLQARAEGFTGVDAATRIAELRNLSRTMDLRADATDFAGRSTYNHDPQGWLGYFSNAIGSASEKYPALKLFVPFTRIVANVTNRGLNYTPLGFRRAFYGYERGKPLEGDARASMLARAVFGTLGMTTLLGMQAAGKLEINGAGPSDPDRRRGLESAGWKPYTLKIGDRYWSYVYTPIGLGLSILGNVSDSYRYTEMDQKGAGTRAAYAVLRIGSTVFSQSFLSGLSNLFQVLGGRTEQSIPALNNMFATTAGSISTPRIILDIQRLFDPTRYESTTIAGDLLRNTPFAALTNRVAINAFGEPVLNPSNRFVSEIKSDPVWQLVIAKNLRVSVPDKYTEMPDGKGKGDRRRITPEEYYEVLLGSGKQLKQYMLEHLLDFQQADEETAQKALDYAATGIRGKWMHDVRKRAL